ncbi:hypothetical protein Ndes2526B_g08876 [Nannochloris sp. 'desiccata']|nr:hypothetical protein KSW81_001563 [Chlorella desiccata (nom. nud.)]KAH7616772.1 putative Protein OPI10-like protein [Chlorella desiccata (nom. nud.)]
MALFAACFPTKSCAIPNTAWTQVDATHWLLDVTSTVSQQHTDLKEICFFLTAPNSLPPDAALALYVSVGGSDFSFRGYIANTHPSEVLPLSWPDPPSDNGPIGQPGWAQIGISVEPLNEATAKEGTKLGQKEDFCRRVGMDLFNFMQSFSGVSSSVGPDKLLVPANVLDLWFNRMSGRLKRDPDFLTRQKEII